MLTKKYMLLVLVLVAAATALSCWRLQMQTDHFQQLVDQSAIATEGYDQEFIAMVERLEDELATRASFPYMGKKDPMTGKIRTVVVAKAPPPERKRRERVRTETPAAVEAPVAVVEERDPVRLTAVIFDDLKKSHTAIMMVGERSVSVEEGDKVYGRIAKGITVSTVTLEDQNKIYEYHISGQSRSRDK